VKPSPLAFDDVGEGPAVVLIHGHPFDRSMWAPQHGPLAEAGFRVIAPDLRGFGASAATTGTVTMRDLASDIPALLDRLELASAAVIGLSMGGLIVMELVEACPERFWAFGFVATTAQPVTAEERASRLAMAKLLEEEGMEPLARSMSERLYGPSCPPEVIELVNRMMRANNPLGAAAALRGRAQRPDYRKRLAKITAPAFVCVGSADPWSTSAVTEELLSCLSAPSALVLDRVGHLPNLEAPAAFNRALVDFLRAAKPNRGSRC
jgi:3-oxoadipate enol-lactonase